MPLIGSPPMEPVRPGGVAAEADGVRGLLVAGRQLLQAVRVVAGRAGGEVGRGGARPRAAGRRPSSARHGSLGRRPSGSATPARPGGSRPASRPSMRGRSRRSRPAASRAAGQRSARSAAVGAKRTVAALAGDALVLGTSPGARTRTRGRSGRSRDRRRPAPGPPMSERCARGGSRTGRRRWRPPCRPRRGRPRGLADDRGRLDRRSGRPRRRSAGERGAGCRGPGGRSAGARPPRAARSRLTGRPPR